MFADVAPDVGEGSSRRARRQGGVLGVGLSDVQIHAGDCVDFMRTLPACSVDAIITDVPYPEVDRDYGVWSESEWWKLMMDVCVEARRVLKPSGSAMFILSKSSLSHRIRA